MATRRPATSLPGDAGPRRTPLGLALAAVAMGFGLAPAPVAAQYMALTATAPTQPPPAVPEPPKPVPPAARPVEHAFNGPLPNQRTGPGRQRVVRDICIGCDR